MASIAQLLAGEEPRIRLMYVRQRASPYSHLSVNIIREVCEYLPSILLLPSVYQSTLCVYNIENRSSVKFTLPHLFASGTVFCFYSRLLLLGVGGEPKSKEVWSFDMGTSTLVPMTHMKVARAWSGVVKVREAVYVFGGNIEPSLQSCEAMDVSTRQWRRVADMHHPRVAFTPAVHGGEIYLACCMQVECPVEVFSLTCCDFHVLPISVDTGAYGCVSFFADNSLMLITSNQTLVTFRLNNYRKETAKIHLKFNSVAASNTPVVMYQQQVWWVDYMKGNAVRFNRKSNLIRVFAFSSPIENRIQTLSNEN